MVPRTFKYGFMLLFTVLGAFSEEPQPNVLIIITDDQGFGDLGITGNPYIETPNIDLLARNSVQLTRFYVSPVCSPTRSSLLTGRWNYRTGVVDTYIGRSMMHNDEITLAEVFRDAGYRTGIFGKWHLGDNYPMRPQDQGFEEVLVHKGGGIAQAAGPKDNHYQDPRLEHNGVEEAHRGYCTDIFFDAAGEYIRGMGDDAFFVVLATNAPHLPLEISDNYAKKYLDKGLEESTAKIYGMVENIDENVGKLMKVLQDTALAENTIVIFMTDNGPYFLDGNLRYNAGMRGQKGTVYEGGIHVPCFIHWPGLLPSGVRVPYPIAHVDIYPTLLAACNLNPPNPDEIDGINVLPWLRGTDMFFPERNLFLQWHRGNVPNAYENCAVIGPQYKLINGAELYDILNDPAEKSDLASSKPELVSDMRKAYDAWFSDVGAARGYDPPRIHIGSEQENPVILSPQDWRGDKAGGSVSIAAHWEVEVEQTGTYTITLDFVDELRASTAKIKVNYTDESNNVEMSKNFPDGSSNIEFDSIQLNAGQARLGFELGDSPKGKGVRFLYVEHVIDENL